MEALPRISIEFVQLRQKCQKHRIVLSQADVFETIHNVRVNPEFAQILLSQADVFEAVRNVWSEPRVRIMFRARVGRFVVVDLRLTFGWRRSPGYCGACSVAAEHAHCKTNIADAIVLEEGRRRM